MAFGRDELVEKSTWTGRWVGGWWPPSGAVERQIEFVADQTFPSKAPPLPLTVREVNKEVGKRESYLFASSRRTSFCKKLPND